MDCHQQWKIGLQRMSAAQNIDAFSDQGVHLSKGWVNNEIEVANDEKSLAQKNLRKKILKHDSSKAHVTAGKIKK